MAQTNKSDWSRHFGLFILIPSFIIFFVSIYKFQFGKIPKHEFIGQLLFSFWGFLTGSSDFVKPFHPKTAKFMLVTALIFVVVSVFFSTGVFLNH